VRCLVTLLAVWGCSGAAADHETLGDRAYLGREYGDALVEYRLALRQIAPNPRLRAKAAAAGLRAGDLLAATEEYLALARESDAREDEAADGLERVAQAAIRTQDRLALRAAMGGLRDLAANRVVGTFGSDLAATLGDEPPVSEALTVLPYAAASAPDARAQDSLMYEYGRALVRAGRCEAAVPVFESLLRREREPAVLEGARRLASSCALGMGHEALRRGQPTRAEEWFRRATQAGETTVGRSAYVGLGDVMFARCDLAGALEAYQRARFGAPPGDSAAAVAGEKINLIANAAAGTVCP
jgi:tetratricopeptide (TPR) repeat protein